MRVDLFYFVRVFKDRSVDNSVFMWIKDMYHTNENG